MNRSMTEKVLHASIQFFDSNPIGRIVTRFSKDLAVFDLIIPVIVLITVQGFFRTGSVTIAIAIVNPWSLIVIFFAILCMYWVVTHATQVMVEAQRLDAIFRGPIHGTFAMVVNGLVSLRSANRMQFFRKDFLLNVELASNATFCYVIVNRWIGLRLDIICGSFIVSVAIFAMTQRDKIDPELLAMSLQIVSDIIFLFSISFRMFAEIENFMTSSQRIIEYTQLEQEDDLEKP